MLTSCCLIQTKQCLLDGSLIHPLLLLLLLFICALYSVNSAVSAYLILVVSSKKFSYPICPSCRPSQTLSCSTVPLVSYCHRLLSQSYCLSKVTPLYSQYIVFLRPANLLPFSNYRLPSSQQKACYELQDYSSLSQGL